MLVLYKADIKFSDFEDAILTEPVPANAGNFKIGVDLGAQHGCCARMRKFSYMPNIQFNRRI